MKVFIAGGTGFVGEHLTAELLKRGHELILLSHAGSGKVQPGITLSRGMPKAAPESYQQVMKVVMR